MTLSFQAPGEEHLSNGSGGITFDPLAVAAVLPNPRAGASAVRLYTQHYREDYRWPYLTMLGGTLPPLGALVDHILYPQNSVHPALSMSLQTVRQLPIKSDTIFQELPLDFSNNWMGLARDFKPSEEAADNDFMIVNMSGKPRAFKKGSLASKMGVRIFFTGVNFLNGMVLCVLLAISIVLGDPWAMCLFFVYLLHWIASTLITYSRLVGYSKTPPKVVPDNTQRYALFERKAPEGGTVVFKGQQDQLEAWARRTWQFYGHSFRNNVFHWSWMLTGSLAALVSTAAMVNMVASLQLAFLGLLLYGSIFDIILTRVSQQIEKTCYDQEYKLLGENKYRTQAIIRATLEPDERLRLDGLDWVGMGALPKNIPIFADMLSMLADINHLQPFTVKNHPDIIALVDKFRATYPNNSLAERICDEITAAVDNIIATANQASP